MTTHSWTADEVRALGVITDLTTAGAVLKLGRTTSYNLAREDAFPVPVLRLRGQYRVRVSDLVQFLGLDLAGGLLDEAA